MHVLNAFKNEEILKTFKPKSKGRVVFDLFTSGFEIDEILKKYPNTFNNSLEIRDTLKGIRKTKKEALESIYQNDMIKIT